MTITLAQNAARVSYSVSEGATQTSFTVSFEFFDAADLNVYVDGTLKTISTHYTVSGGSGSTGAVAISVTGASGGSTVVITRSIALARTTDFPTSGSFQIATLNTELDRFTAIAADLKDSVDRSLQLTDFDSAVSLVLPAVADRKGKVLAFNASTGAVEAGASVSAVQSVADNAAAVNLLGTAAVVADLNILATDAAVADMAILATSAIVADMAILATDAIVADMAILATSDIVADMALLATDAIVADMALLGTSAVIEDMGLLATAAVIEDMGQLANSTVLSNIATLASNNSPSISAITVGGASQLNGTLTVGANDQGYDVTLHGDTAARNVVWDSSADSLIFSDNAKAVFGAGSDLQIYHDGSHSIIRDAGTGNLKLWAENFSVQNSNGSEQMILATPDGSANLYYNGTKKFETTATGVEITGAATVGGAAVKVAGKESIWIPAAAMYPSTTNPCSDLTQVETTALRPDLKVLDFAADADDFAQFSVAFPKSWNLGTISYQPFWTVTGTNAGTVVWQLGGVAITNDETLNTAFGTLVATTALAHSTTSNDLMVSAESGAVTIAGSPADNDQCFFQINLDTSASGQTGAVRLLGVKLFFTTDAANDA